MYFVVVEDYLVCCLVVLKLMFCSCCVGLFYRVLVFLFYIIMWSVFVVNVKSEINVLEERFSRI